jgi:hypothetical protein
MGYENVEGINLAQNRIQRRVLVNTVTNVKDVQIGQLIYSPRDYWLARNCLIWEISVADHPVIHRTHTDQNRRTGDGSWEKADSHMKITDGTVSNQTHQLSHQMRLTAIRHAIIWLRAINVLHTCIQACNMISCSLTRPSARNNCDGAPIKLHSDYSMVTGYANTRSKHDRVRGHTQFWSLRTVPWEVLRKMECLVWVNNSTFCPHSVSVCFVWFSQ